MKLRRWHWLILALIVLIAGGYLLSRKLPGMIEQRIGRELAAVGVESFEIGAPFWGLSGAGTRELKARGQADNWQFDIRVEDLQADYHWRALLAGQISRISMAKIQFKARQVSPSSEQPMPEMDIRTLLNQVRNFSFPIDNIQIGSIDGDVSLNGADIGIGGDGFILDNAAKAISGKIRLNAKGRGLPDNMDIAASLEPSAELPWIPRIELQVAKEGQGFLTAGLEMAHSDSTTLALNALFHDSDLGSLLTDIHAVPPLPDMPLAAKLSLQATVSVPDILDLNDAGCLKTLPANLSLVGDLESGAYPRIGLARSTTRFSLAVVNSGDDLTTTLTEPVAFTADVDHPELARQLGLKGSNPVSMRLTANSPLVYSHNGALEAGRVDLAMSIADNNRLALAISDLAIMVSPPSVSDGDAHGWLNAITGSANLNADLKLASYPMAHLKQVTSQVSVKASKEPGSLNLSLLAPLSVSANVVLDNWPELAEQLKLNNPTTLSMGLSSEGPLAYRLAGKDTGTLNTPALTINLADDNDNNLNLRIEQAVIAETISLKGRGEASLHHGGNRLPALSATAVLTGNKSNPHLKGTFALTDPGVTGRLTARPFASTVTFDGSVNLNDLPGLFKQAEDLGLDLPDIQLASGEVALSVSGQGSASASASSLVLGWQAKEVSGLYSGFAFSDLGVVGELEFDGAWRSTAPVRLSVPNASAGVELSNIEAELSLLESPRLVESRWRLDAFSANAFSGQIGLSEPAVVDIPFNQNKLTVSLSNLNLADILTLYASQGVSGTGRLSGTIPLVLTEEGIHVDGGRLHNLDLGRIQFSHGGTAGIGNEQLAMTMRLLEDFNYELLDITTTLEPDGQLLLAARLSGNNPVEFDGRTVNFNINLEENIFDLYKVLSLSDKLTRQLEKKIEGQ